MCLAIPSKIIKIEKGWATVQSEGHTHKTNLSLLNNAKVGDYVLVHGDLAINKVEKKEVDKILKLTNNLKHDKRN